MVILISQGRAAQDKTMLIYGASLSFHCAFAVPFLHVGGIWHNIGGRGSSNCPSKWARRRSITCKYSKSIKSVSLSRACRRYSLALICFLAAAAVRASVAASDAIREPETLSNIPQTLSAECKLAKDCKKAKIQRPKSRKAESCTIRCVTTCIRGGEGSPGEGPLNVRRPLVVFKQGFRTRQYCLVECSDICNLIGDANDEP